MQPILPHITSCDRPFYGYGLGLRPTYYQTILDTQPYVDWFEIISENYMLEGGKPLYFLDKIRANYPIAMHGVSLSLGSTDPLDLDYIKRLKTLAARVEPMWISDHLCWTSHGGHHLHDLLPLPYTEESINHVVARIQAVQEYLGQRILLENVSSYITYLHSTMPEWEFYNTIAQRADCLLLLDINNIYVSSVNHQTDPMDYINAVSPERVYQFHLAGHTNNGDHIIDTHDHPVIEGVWTLYEKALQRFGAVSTMIERDDRFPPFEELLQELAQARQLGQNILGQSHANTTAAAILV